MARKIETVEPSDADLLAIAPEAGKALAEAGNPPADTGAPQDGQPEQPQAPEAPTGILAELAAIDAALAEATLPVVVNALLAEQAKLLENLAAEQAASQAEQAKAAELEAANKMAASFGLAPDSLARILAEIERKYAPVQPEAEQAEAPASQARTRRQLSPVNVERNEQAAALPADSPRRQRAEAYLTAMLADHGTLGCTARIEAGTRYPGLACLAPSGTGVSSAADWIDIQPVVRTVMLDRRYKPNGAGACEAAWAAGTGRYASSGDAGHKAIEACYSVPGGAALYLCADGRFRILANRSDAAKAGRRVRNDAAAQAVWFGTGDAEAALSAPASQAVPVSSAAAPVATLATLANCRHCNARNAVAFPTCRACKSADWQPQAAE